MESHNAQGEFNETYEIIVDCLSATSKNDKHIWNSKAMTEAFGLLCSIPSSQFIAAFQVNKRKFGYTKCLSCSRVLRKVY